MIGLDGARVLIEWAIFAAVILAVALITAHNITKE